jgi:aspartate/methionine/tyrosine aminotransferase
MGPELTPVLLTAIIVFGIMGTKLGTMVVRELVPLLRALAERPGAIGSSPEMERLPTVLESLDRRLESLEARQRRLEEDREFMVKLLESPRVKVHADDRET